MLFRSVSQSRYPQWNTQGDSGRADLIVAKYSKAVSVEVKRGTDSFNLAGWRDNQRAWAIKTTKMPYEVPYWVYLTLGKDAPNRDSERYSPARSWLIPLSMLEKCLVEISPHQGSIPYRIKKGGRKITRENQWDAIHLFQRYELDWASAHDLVKPTTIQTDKEKESGLEITYGGFWIIPEKHDFYKEYILK